MVVTGAGRFREWSQGELPLYVNLGLIKLPDIVKLYTCQLLYDYLIDKKSSNFNLSLVPEQHKYATRSASLQLLKPSSFRINIRKFFPTVIGCYYWNDIPLSIRNKPTRKLFKRALYQYYFAQYYITSAASIIIFYFLYIYSSSLFFFFSSFYLKINSLHQSKGIKLVLLYLALSISFYSICLLKRL